MQSRHSPPVRRAGSPRPTTQRQRSNSFPIVEALGCSTPEAQLLLAEGRAAVRKRRARRRRNRSFDDEENGTTFDPRDHMKYLESERPTILEARTCHARLPSNATDQSTSTIVAHARETGLHDMASPASPLGKYSAHLAQFIKEQLNSIPTYHSEHRCDTNLSPRSCPEFSLAIQPTPLSPNSFIRRPTDQPKAIDIPPVRPPMRSAFSAWSSTDDDDDDEFGDMAPALPEMDQYTMDLLSRARTCTPSEVACYDASRNTSFLFSSTPSHGEDCPDTAKEPNFAVQPAFLGSVAESHDETDSPSSSLSRPQLTSSSEPSFTSSSASASSYFQYKRPPAVAPQMKDRIIAALTPPQPYGKIISAISPWEGGAIANVHNVFVESQQRVHVDGMSFDMLRELSFRFE